MQDLKQHFQIALEDSRPLNNLIVDPTGTGKTHLALAQCETHLVVYVNCRDQQRILTKLLMNLYELYRQQEFNSEELNRAALYVIASWISANIQATTNLMTYCEHETGLRDHNGRQAVLRAAFQPSYADFVFSQPAIVALQQFRGSSGYKNVIPKSNCPVIVVMDEVRYILHHFPGIVQHLNHDITRQKDEVSDNFQANLQQSLMALFKEQVLFGDTVSDEVKRRAVPACLYYGLRVFMATAQPANVSWLSLGTNFSYSRGIGQMDENVFNTRRGFRLSLPFTTTSHNLAVLQAYFDLGDCSDGDLDEIRKYLAPFDGRARPFFEWAMPTILARLHSIGTDRLSKESFLGLLKDALASALGVCVAGIAAGLKQRYFVSSVERNALFLAARAASLHAGNFVSMKSILQHGIQLGILKCPYEFKKQAEGSDGIAQHTAALLRTNLTVEPVVLQTLIEIVADQETHCFNQLRDVDLNASANGFAMEGWVAMQLVAAAARKPISVVEALKVVGTLYSKLPAELESFYLHRHVAGSAHDYLAVDATYNESGMASEFNAMFHDDAMTQPRFDRALFPSVQSGMDLRHHASRSQTAPLVIPKPCIRCKYGDHPPTAPVLFFMSDGARFLACASCLKRADSDFPLIANALPCTTECKPNCVTTYQCGVCRKQRWRGLGRTTCDCADMYHDDLWTAHWKDACKCGSSDVVFGVKEGHSQLTLKCRKCHAEDMPDADDLIVFDRRNPDGDSHAVSDSSDSDYDSSGSIHVNAPKTDEPMLNASLVCTQCHHTSATAVLYNGLCPACVQSPVSNASLRVSFSPQTMSVDWTMKAREVTDTLQHSIKVSNIGEQFVDRRGSNPAPSNKRTLARTTPETDLSIVNQENFWKVGRTVLVDYCKVHELYCSGAKQTLADRVADHNKWTKQKVQKLNAKAAVTTRSEYDAAAPLRVDAPHLRVLGSTGPFAPALRTRVDEFNRLHPEQAIALLTLRTPQSLANSWTKRQEMKNQQECDLHNYKDFTTPCVCVFGDCPGSPASSAAQTPASTALKAATASTQKAGTPSPQKHPSPTAQGGTPKKAKNATA
eukprot:TRINITY_DN7129_c0_g1_i1.p1 TRINITY_DN7129_c0_g1~~TRINITY_DN7129_c0_g1_i1.p1  ORF type:complete len:1073 (+),score=131.50 TRINITY_DN7129_c0_g1_i1:749-3967(+)